MMQWESARDLWSVKHHQHLGLTRELDTPPPAAFHALSPCGQHLAAVATHSVPSKATLLEQKSTHSHMSSGTAWREQRSVSLGGPASSEALSWVAAWGRMAAAQGCEESHLAGGSPHSAPSSAAVASQLFSPFSPLSPPTAARRAGTTTAATSARRRLPELSLTLSVGSPELPMTQLSGQPVALQPKHKSKAKRAASAIVGGCASAPKTRKAQPAHTVALGESHRHIRARLAPPPTASRTPLPASAAATQHHYAPDGISTTSLPQLPPLAPHQRAQAVPRPLSPPLVAMHSTLLPFAAGCHSPVTTPCMAEAAAACRRQELEREELWMGGGGAEWVPSATAAGPGGAPGWQEAAEAELLGCMDAAELEALDAALEALNDEPCDFWL